MEAISLQEQLNRFLNGITNENTIYYAALVEKLSNGVIRSFDNSRHCIIFAKDQLELFNALSSVGLNCRLDKIGLVKLGTFIIFDTKEVVRWK